MLGEKLMKLRKKQGYSQQEVAELLSVTRQTISNWESGQGAPALDKATELASLYKINLNDLVSDEVEVLSVGSTFDNGKDLHVLHSLEGKTCKIDCVSDEWYLIQGFDVKVKILEVSEDWIRIEYEKSKDTNPFKKETVIQLMDVAMICGFIVVEEDH